MLVSIIALNWNGKRFIDPLMDSIKNIKCDSFDIEFLFVDNNSSDESVEYYRKKYLNEQFRLIENDDNYGYSKGNNLGIMHAKGEYILVINNDLILDANVVEELLTVMRKKRAQVVVPKLMFLNKEGYINNAGSKLDPTDSWPVTEVGMNEKDVGQYDSVREITAFCGACVMFSRNFLQTVGMFDDKFFMYFEDSDLSWRGQTKKSKFYYAPRALAYHHHTGSSVEGSKMFNYYVARNRVLILLKNASPRVIYVGYRFAVRDHLYYKAKNILKALLGRYPKKTAIKEGLLGLKTFLGIVIFTPYALAKRFHILKERKL